MKKINYSYFALFALLLVPLFVSESFASTETQLEWQLVFLSDKPGCANAHYSATVKYAEITEGYLGMYGVDNLKHPHVCVSDSKYFEKLYKLLMKEGAKSKSSTGSRCLSGELFVHSS